MAESNRITPLPDGIIRYNGSTDKCDMLEGPCACGAWHKLEEWKDYIVNDTDDKSILDWSE